MRRRPPRSARDLSAAVSGIRPNAQAAAAIPAALLAVALALPAAAGGCASAPAAEEAPARASSLPAAAVTDAAAAPPTPPPAPAADPGAWKRVLPRPELPAGRPLRVAFLLADGVEGAEAAAVRAVLHRAAARLGEPGIELVAVSPDGGAVTTAEGLRLAADRSFADPPDADVLVVPGGAAGSSAAAAAVDWLRRAGAAARWTVALSDGAFLAARAGLLDGLAATTAPAAYDRFAQQFPGVELRVNASFVHDGRALTSQGGARSVEVALYLVDHLYGEAAARAVGEELLVGWPTDPADEPPFVVVPRPATHPDAPPAAAGDGSP